MSLYTRPGRGPSTRSASLRDVYLTPSLQNLATENVESPKQPPPHLPERVGSYRLEAVLGRGGMGEVYRAHHETLDRPVAIKAIHESAIEDEEHRKRFRQEARLAARLNHPAIVQIYDFLETEDGDFIVMELVEGSALRKIQRQRTFAVLEILEIGGQIAEALDLAHRQGIVHRDLKAENVMINSEGRVKLLDFGLAKRFRLPDGDSVVEDEAETGQVLGTLRAMSPEQARGQKLDGRSDLFSLGVLLYELCTGESPFRGKGVAATLQQICSHYPTPVHRVRTDLPLDLSRILEHLLEKDPVLRPQRAAEVVQNLRRLIRLFAEEETGPLVVAEPRLNDSETGLVSADLQDLTLREASPVGPPLPGRMAELDRLQRAWTRALEGHRQMVFISGEPGIGKSTLVGRFTQGLRASKVEVAVAEGRCLELYGAGEAFLPILEALGRLCRGEHGRATKRVLLQWAPGWLLQLPGMIEEDEREEVMRRTLGAGPARRLLELLEALDALCRRRPLLLVLEDLHWSDAATLDLLSALARRIEPARLMIVGTIRTSEAPLSEALQSVVRDLTLRSSAEEIELKLLSEQETAQMLFSARPEWRMGQDLAELVHRHAGGNPLFSLHLAEILQQGEEGRRALEDESDEGDEELDLYENLDRILESLLQRVDPKVQELLQVAAVAGERFLLPVVAEASGIDQETCESLLDDLAKRRSFLRRLPSVKLKNGLPAKRYVFLHNIYRRVLRRRLSSGATSECHRVVAEALEKWKLEVGGAPANELALHYELGGRPRQAIHQYEQAAQVAVGRGAFAAGIEHVRRAQTLLAPLQDEDEDSNLSRTQVGLSSHLGVALFATEGFSSPDGGDAYRAAEQLGEALRDPRLFSVRCGLWVYHWMRAEIPKSVEIAESARQQIEDDPQADPYARLLSHVILAASYMRRGDFSDALDHFERGLAYSDEVGIQGLFKSFALVEGRVFGRVFGALTLWYLGRADEAREWALEGNRIANEIGHAFSRLNASSVASTLFLLCGETVRARELHMRAESISEEHGYAISVAPRLRSVMFEPNPAAAAVRLDVLERKIDAARERGEVELQNIDYLMLAHARKAAGRLDQAREALASGVEVSRRSGDTWYEAEILRQQAALLIESEGDYPEIRHQAEEILNQALAVAERQGAKAWTLRIATSLARLHDRSYVAAEARLRLQSVVDGFGQGHETADMKIARSLLAGLPVG